MKRRDSAMVQIFCGALALGLVAAGVAQAVIPEPGRTIRAIAEVNRQSSRHQALQLEMKLRIGEEPPIADAELISHPSGLARLEIRGFDGRVDRYLLSGTELTGTKNGEQLFRPRPVLQPFFLLQAGSESTLRTALETFGVRTGSIGFAPCGEEDCLVIGDPRLEAPYEPSPADAPDAAGSGALDSIGLDSGSRDARLRAPGNAVDSIGERIIDGRLPRFWVDTQSLQVQRIDRADGMMVIFGPTVNFEKIQVPSWFEIHDAAEPFPMRFEVQRAVQVNAPPKAFDPSWLIPPAFAGSSTDR
jgi:hypothetical protein